jgi:hypothetical protein
VFGQPRHSAREASQLQFKAQTLGLRAEGRYRPIILVLRYYDTGGFDQDKRGRPTDSVGKHRLVSLVDEGDIALRPIPTRGKQTVAPA